MFESLSDRLSGILDKLTRRGSLTDSDVAEAMREVRRALLEADVALEVVRDFIEKVRAKAIGRDVVKSVTPGQMVVKIVHDELVAMLGSSADPIDLAAQPPVAIMLVGLQGSGKTTTCAKIGYRLTNRDKKKVLMASLDTRRPAAQEQLKVLGEQTKVDTLPIVPGQSPQQITRRAMDAAALAGYDVLLLDTAGRTHIDDDLMREARGDAKAHQVAGHRREMGRTRRFPPRTHRRAHSRYGRRRQPGREGGANDRRRQGAGDRRKTAQGRVRS
jgi:signal recognition particle subunit SRP54